MINWKYNKVIGTVISTYADQDESRHIIGIVIRRSCWQVSKADNTPRQKIILLANSYQDI